MIYEPREDSHLLAKWVIKLAFGNVLDMGSGSGVQAEAAKKSPKVRHILVADINPETIALLTAKGFRAVQSDLFSKISGTFDTIIFNPPYLPEDAGYKDIALDGGKKGHEVLDRFLACVKAHLKPNGIVLIVFSSLTGKEKVDERIAHHGLEYELLETGHISFEDLYVYTIRKTQFTQLLEAKGITAIERFAKGHRGVIFTGVLGKKSKKKIAVKTQRQDIGAHDTVNNEVKRLKLLNKHGIGPKLLFSGTNYFVYEFVPGKFIEDFVSSASKKDILSILKDIFSQMRVMDMLGLSKEEMHHPVKHVIVTTNGKTTKAVLLDFERCKPTEKPHNVTQFCQYLRSTRFHGLLRRRGIVIESNKLLELAKTYKAARPESVFKKMLQLLQ